MINVMVTVRVQYRGVNDGFGMQRLGTTPSFFKRPATPQGLSFFGARDPSDTPTLLTTPSIRPAWSPARRPVARFPHTTWGNSAVSARHMRKWCGFRTPRAKTAPFQHGPATAVHRCLLSMSWAEFSLRPPQLRRLVAPSARRWVANACRSCLSARTEHKNGHSRQGTRDLGQQMTFIHKESFPSQLKRDHFMSRWGFAAGRRRLRGGGRTAPRHSRRHLRRKLRRSACRPGPRRHRSRQPRVGSAGATWCGRSGAGGRLDIAKVAAAPRWLTPAAWCAATPSPPEPRTRAFA